MPSTRNGRDVEMLDDLPSDDEFDPDYTEGESSDDELPAAMGRDRAHWVEDNTDALEDLYRQFLETGRQLFGNAFHQTGNITAFCHYVYRYTTPGAN